eukprot:234764_1
MSDSYRSTSLSILNQWYWLQHKQLICIPSQLIAYDAKNAKFKSVEDEIITIESSELSSLKPADTHIHQICDDLEELDELNKFIILHHLRTRYKQQRIYTNIGNILIYVNQYNVDIFTQNRMINYHKSLSTNAPHIYKL